MAIEAGQDLNKIHFKDQSWLGLKTRSRDATLSRHKGININELALHTRIATTPSGNLNKSKMQIFGKSANMYLFLFRRYMARSLAKERHSS